MPCIRRYCFILCCCISSVFISACSGDADDSIRFGLESDPVTLDPRFATDAVSYRITRLLYRSLVDFDDGFQFVPDLASWQTLTRQHYRFTLKNDDTTGGRQFHSGVKLVADDVKATYDYVLDVDNASPHRGSIDIVKAVNVIDEDTVDFILKRPDPLFPARLVIGIMPASLINSGHEFSRQPVGSGPCIFEQWNNYGELSLRRLSDDQILKFITVADPTVRVLKILRNELDILQGDIPREMIPWLAERSRVHIEKIPSNTFTYIGLNMADGVTGQLLVRRAIAHAINREDIIRYIMGGTARKAGSILPPLHWSGHAGLSGVEFDLRQSRSLLESAGYSESNPLRLSYKTSNNPFRLRLATIIQYQLEQAGIQIDVRSYDWGTFYGDIKAGHFQMYSLSWVGLKTPDIFRYVFHSNSLPPEGANRGRFLDPVADAMIEDAESQYDLIEQARQYQYLQAYLHEQLPYIPLWYEDNILIRAKSVSRYTVSTDGSYDGLLTARRN